MRTKQEKGPLVWFGRHNTEYYTPHVPKDAMEYAQSIPALAPYTQTVFALFRPDPRLRFAPDWMESFRLATGGWGGHISLAWYARGHWLFASRSGLAILGNQAGFFDFVQFEQYRRQSAEFQKGLRRFTDLSGLRESWERTTGKPFQLAPPVILELWVVLNQTASRIAVEDWLSNRWGEVPPKGVMSFLIWEQGRIGLAFMRGRQRVGRFSGRRLLYERGEGSAVHGMVLDVPAQGLSVESVGRIVGEKGVDEALRGRFDQLFDRLVVVLLEERG